MDYAVLPKVDGSRVHGFQGGVQLVVDVGDVLILLFQRHLLGDGLSGQNGEAKRMVVAVPPVSGNSNDAQAPPGSDFVNRGARASDVVVDGRGMLG